MFASLIRLIRLTAFLLFLLLVIVFTVSNRGTVNLSLYPLPFEMTLPVYLFFLISLAAGYLWGLFSGGVLRMRHKMETRKERKRVDALEQEVSGLRAQQTVLSSPSLLP